MAAQHTTIYENLCLMVSHVVEQIASYRLSRDPLHFWPLFSGVACNQTASFWASSKYNCVEFCHDHLLQLWNVSLFSSINFQFDEPPQEQVTQGVKSAVAEVDACWMSLSHLWAKCSPNQSKAFSPHMTGGASFCNNKARQPDLMLRFSYFTGFQA